MFRVPIALFAAYISIVSSVNSVSPPKRNLLRLVRNLEEDEDYSWLIDYSLKFDSCHTHEEFVTNDGVGSIFKQKLVKFNICSSEECGSDCEGGRYLVQLEDFVQAYADQKEADEDYACEQVKDNCNCDYDDGDDCEDNCYSDAGLDYCIEGDDDAEQVDIRNYIECQEFVIEDEEDENGDDNEQEISYIGLKCSDNGKGVNLGIFTDEYCTIEKEDSDSLSFEYQSESFISDDCMNCAYTDNEEDDGAEVSEMCENSYFESLKCEENLSLTYPDNEGCDLIDSYNLGGSADQRHFRTAVAFAAVFFTMSVILAAISIRLCLTSKRDIALNDEAIHRSSHDPKNVKSPTSRFKMPNLKCFRTTIS